MSFSALKLWFVLLPATLLAAAALSAGEAPGGRQLGRSFDSSGVNIRYYVQGQGEAVVLIHGWLSSAGINWMLPGTAEWLARDFRVISLDMRGHGLSDKPAREEDYGPEMVMDIARLLDHLQIRKAHLVGYSMGGIVAMNFMTHFPDRVLSGTLGGMGWLRPGGVAQSMFARIGRNDPHAHALALCGRGLAKLAVTEEELRGIQVPVTLLVGEKDAIIQRLYVEPLKKVRPDWPVVTIRDADHLDCIVKPQFREAITEHLKAVSERK